MPTHIGTETPLPAAADETLQRESFPEIDRLLNDISPSNPELSETLKNLDALISVDSSDKENPIITHLFKRKALLILSSLEGCVFNTKDFTHLSSLFFKIDGDMKKLKTYYTLAEWRAIIASQLRFSHTPGLSVETSLKFFTNYAYLMTCTDTAEAQRVLLDRAREEVASGRIFNAARALLCWLFCTDDDVVTPEHISVIADLLARVLEYFTTAPRSKLFYVGLSCVSLFIMNTFVTLNAEMVRPLRAHWLRELGAHGMDTPAVFASFGRFVRVTMHDTSCLDDMSKVVKMVNRIAFIVQFYHQCIVCTSFTTFVNLWASTVDPAAARDVRLEFTAHPANSLNRCILAQRVDKYGAFVANARTFITTAGPDTEARAAATEQLFRAIFGFALFSGPKMFHALNMLVVVKVFDATQFGLFVVPIVSLVQDYLRYTIPERALKIRNVKLLPAALELLDVE
eukprot:gnl/Chilomastix_cuspidata/1789.p1 GENE.gnl/Chilomastix_cuspidata/1789~~gnl/Chilomastix_cuspidata/1789.p1  ORF type:complete len:457 (+),score=156.59 gnl/Chilomastix_cuspidata/1789:1030-2400(+)